MVKSENIIEIENNISSIQSESINNNKSDENLNIETNNSQTVYWTKSGKKYHSDSSCSGMKSPISGTIKDSQRTPCSKCY